ncbi:hypothetical protein ABEW03_03625 [Virgibacillus pantothenticus]|uniref:Y-family DNA polymerase n=1 Tax=Virgibacillus pantothenticus TaxID=1473 RepID=UPI00279619F7|nr:hypothetical protein [Virgibacillus pantothenticus]
MRFLLLKKRYGISNVSRYYELPNDPDIIVVPAHMEDYLKVSVKITKLLQNYAPFEAIHVYSVDESWVTIDGLKRLYGGPWEIARKIQRDILNQFGVTSSIGIGVINFLQKSLWTGKSKESLNADTRMYQRNCGHPRGKIFGG